ncbi:MAG: hypothetical protein ACRDRU_25740 [Pseudonocardiaceae bacterium]
MRKPEWPSATATLGEVGDHAVKELAKRLLGRLAVVLAWSLPSIYSAVQDSSGLAKSIREAVQRIFCGGLADEVDDRKESLTPPPSGTEHEVVQLTHERRRSFEEQAAHVVARRVPALGSHRRRP